MTSRLQSYQPETDDRCYFCHDTPDNEKELPEKPSWVCHTGPKNSLLHPIHTNCLKRTVRTINSNCQACRKPLDISQLFTTSEKIQNTCAEIFKIAVPLACVARLVLGVALIPSLAFVSNLNNPADSRSYIPSYSSFNAPSNNSTMIPVNHHSYASLPQFQPYYLRSITNFSERVIHTVDANKITSRDGLTICSHNSPDWRTKTDSLDTCDRVDKKHPFSDPDQLVKHKECLDYLEKNLLENPNFFTDSNLTKIETSILKTRDFLIEGSNSSFMKSKSYKNRVKDLVLKFSKELKELGSAVESGNQDAIAVAAWAHQQIIRLDLFSNNYPEEKDYKEDDLAYLNLPSERLARAWMNVILQKGGIEAVVFKDPDFFGFFPPARYLYYELEVHEDIHNPGRFSRFLRFEIKKREPGLLSRSLDTAASIGSTIKQYFFQ